MLAGMAYGLDAGPDLAALAGLRWTSGAAIAAMAFDESKRKRRHADQQQVDAPNAIAAIGRRLSRGGGARRHGDAPRGSRPRRKATISAMIERAISSGPMALAGDL